MLELTVMPLLLTVVPCGDAVNKQPKRRIPFLIYSLYGFHESMLIALLEMTEKYLKVIQTNVLWDNTMRK